MRFMSVAVIVASVVAGLALVDRASGQTSPPAPDPTQELMQEVRALRIAIERSTTAGVRSQLLLGRVQLQENRILTLSRHLQSTRDALASTRQDLATAAAALKSMEELSERAASVEQRDAFANEIRQAKLRVERINTEALRLQMEETSAANAVAAEQGRWNDFNQRLEELERSLAAMSR